MDAARWNGNCCPPGAAGRRALYGPFFAAVTQQDLRLRFFAPVKEFGHAFVARFTQIDYARAMAFIAIEVTSSGEMLGWSVCTRTQTMTAANMPSWSAPI